MDLEGQLAHHQRLYTAQGQELEAAAQRLEAAPQQQQEAVAAAEQAAAAGRQRVEADVATLQERLSSQQAQLERIRSSLAATDAEYGGLLAQVAQVQLERDAAAAAASSAANTTQTSLQERLSEVEGSNQQLAADTAAALERKVGG
jgi:chromosome segregation ATPase